MVEGGIMVGSGWGWSCRWFFAAAGAAAAVDLGFLEVGSMGSGTAIVRRL